MCVQIIFRTFGSFSLGILLIFIVGASIHGTSGFFSVSLAFDSKMHSLHYKARQINRKNHSNIKQSVILLDLPLTHIVTTRQNKYFDGLPVNCDSYLAIFVVINVGECF